MVTDAITCTYPAAAIAAKSDSVILEHPTNTLAVAHIANRDVRLTKCSSVG